MAVTGDKVVFAGARMVFAALRVAFARAAGTIDAMTTLVEWWAVGIAGAPMATAAARAAVVGMAAAVACLIVVVTGGVVVIATGREVLERGDLAVAVREARGGGF